MKIYELEDRIMWCWNIVEDLNLSEDPYSKALAVVYERKFNELWEVFGEVVQEHSKR